MASRASSSARVPAARSRGYKPLRGKPLPRGVRRTLRPAPVRIVRLTARDYFEWYPRLLQLDHAAFGDCAEVDVDRWTMAFTHYRIFVALDGARLVGALVATPPTPVRQRSWCWSLGVHPAAQGRGVASKLMRRWFRETWDIALRGWALQVVADNDRAIDLYTRHGFTSRRYIRHYFGRGTHGFRLLKNVE